MAVAKLLNLLAISCLAIIASYGSTSVAAVSVSNHQGRSNLHHAMIKRKRAETSKRCKPRAATSAPAKSTTHAPPKSTTHAPPAPTKSSSGYGTGSNTGNTNDNNNNGGGNTGSSGSSGGGKAGLAWANGNSVKITNFKGPKVSKYYTWSPWSVSNAGGLEFCPMLWGHKQVGDFTKLVKPGYAKCVMGFNEPNQSGQSDMSPGDGANLWRTYINKLSQQGYRTISPAVTSAPSGKQWMKDFFSACSDCQVDVIALHWYGTKSEEFIKYVEDFHNTFKKPIWVTEFACQDFSGGPQANSGQIFDFMKTVTSWMDSTPYVEQYFAFGAMHDMQNVNSLDTLMAASGLPNDLGKLFIGL